MIVTRGSQTLQTLSFPGDPVDAATNLPVRIEQVSAYDAQVKIIAIDFVSDQPIDESLVRIQSPESPIVISTVSNRAAPGAGEIGCHNALFRWP